MSYKIYIRPDELEIDDWILLENLGQGRSLGEVVELLSRFVMLDGKPLPPEEGRRALGKMKLHELVSLLNEAAAGLREVLVPLASAERSGEPS